MDIDPEELIDEAKAASAPSASRLNATVAVTVAVLATFMGICKVKDDNIVQAMQQAQANRVDHWSFYQARNIRQELAEATALQLELAQADRSGAAAERYGEALQKYRALAADQAAKKAELRRQADEDQAEYDRLNFRDDQFDLSDALIAIAIAMLAVTALTQLWALYFAALAPTAFGVAMGLAGLAGWPLHPDALIRLLS